MSFRDTSNTGMRRGAASSMPRSYQMADEEYTAECRDIARKIEEYNTAVGKFVQLGEDALEESGSSDGAASPKQVRLASAAVERLAADITARLGEFSVYYRDQGLTAAERAVRKAQMARFVKDFQKRVARFARLKSDAKANAQRAIARQRAAAAAAGDGDDGGETVRLLRRRQQQQLDARVQLSHAVILEREESIHRIHQDVVEVSNIMSDLARIVQEQQLGVDSIEDNMQTAVRDTELGLQSVTKAQSHAKAGQSKLFLLCVILSVIVAMGLLWLYIFR